MSRKLAFDRVLFVCVAGLALLGLAAVLSASPAVSLQKFGSPYHFFVRQLAWVALGCVVLALAMRVDYRRFNERPVVVLLTLATLGLLVAALLAPPIKGVHRWLRLGPLSLQVSELARVVLVVYLAHHLDRRRELVAERPSVLLPPTLIVVLMVGLVYLQPDLGAALVMATLAVGLVFVAGTSLRALLPGVVAGSAGLVLAVLLSGGYQLDRLKSFVDPAADPLGAGFQVDQSRLAIGSGGVFGRGLGAGRQKLYFLPEPHTDFVFSVFAEELGLMGTTLVLGAFALLALRGLRAARRAPDSFGALLAMGMTWVVVLPASIHVGVAVGALPPTGMTLPFMSYGGSSITSAMLASGILLNVSQHG